MSDSRRGFRLDIGFIDHITRNLFAYNYQITSAARSVFTSSCLVTASNNCFRPQILSEWRLPSNCLILKVIFRLAAISHQLPSLLFTA
jgi:hypothetical protein